MDHKKEQPLEIQEVEERLKIDVPFGPQEILYYRARLESILVADQENTQARELLSKIPESPEGLTDRKIVEIESNMSAFEIQMRPLIDKVSDPALKTALMNPFHFLNANAANPLKNYECVRAEADKAGIPAAAVMLALGNPRHFAYRVVGNELQDHGAMIGNIPIERSIGLSANYDFSITLNRLTMYHEMFHLMHQAGQRMRDINTFISFYARQNRKVIISEEFDAYAMELEALNLLMENQLRKAATCGKTVKPDVIMKTIGSPELHRTPITMLSMLAKEYFAGGSLGNYPESYRKLVEKVCIHDGYALHYYGQPGVPQP